MKNRLCFLGFAVLLAGAAQAAVHTWDGDGVDGNWATGTNWVGDATPTFGNTTDIEISGTANLDQFINSHRVIKSLTFTDSNDGATSLQLVRGSDGADRDLRMTSDTGTSSITVASGSTGDKSIGTTTATSDGEIEMFNDLVITHNGADRLLIRAQIRDDNTANDLTIAGDGETVFFGVSTYAGNTTITGSDVLFANNSGLLFVIGDDGINNSMGGSGTVDIKSDFTFDLTGAGTDVGDSWVIVEDSLTLVGGSIHAQFEVVGWTEVDKVWTINENGVDYQFTEATGVLAVIPEPASLGLIAVTAVSVLFIRRRLML